MVKQDYDKIASIFEHTRNKLCKALGEERDIEHVGSTAVPGLEGKGIIDILVGAKDVLDLDAAENKIIEIGFYASKKGRPSKDRSFLASRAEETKDGDIHIHLVIIDSDCYKDFILLREYLRKNQDEAKSYMAAKHEIIKKANYDRKKYKEHKGTYVDSLLKRARRLQHDLVVDEAID